MGNLPSLLRNDYKYFRFEDEGMFLWIDAVWKKGSSTETINSFLSLLRKRLGQLGDSISVWRLAQQ